MDGNSYLYENFIYLGIKLTNYAVDKIKEIITKEENLQYIRLIYSDRKDEVLNIIISNDKVYDFYIKDITKVADSNQKIRLIMASDTDNLNNQRFIRKRSNNIWRNCNCWSNRYNKCFKFRYNKYKHRFKN